jgi:hypothetical protein
VKYVLGTNFSLFGSVMSDKEKHLLTCTPGGSGSGIQDNSSDESFNKNQVKFKNPLTDFAIGYSKGQKCFCKILSSMRGFQKHQLHNNY